MKKMAILGLTLSLTLTSCTPQQWNQVMQALQEAASSSGGVAALTQQEAAAGLKQALEFGAAYAARTASANDGYWGNARIRIPLPPELQRVEARLRQMGLGNQVDRFLETMNHGAELAAKEAEPIFVDVIRGITIEDAFNILRGEQDAATEYLKEKSTRRLQGAFKPHIVRALEQVNATRYYTDVVNTWNRIPGVQRINPNLEEFVNEKALEGLFFLVAKEELNIRRNVSARSTDLLKKVFDEVNQRAQ